MKKSKFLVIASVLFSLSFFPVKAGNNTISIETQITGRNYVIVGNFINQGREELIIDECEVLSENSSRNILMIDTINLRTEDKEYSSDRTFIASNEIEYGEIEIQGGSSKYALYSFFIPSITQESPGYSNLKNIKIGANKKFSFEILGNLNEGYIANEIYTVKCSNDATEPKFESDPFRLEEEPTPTISELPEPTEELVTPEVTEEPSAPIDDLIENDTNSKVNLYIIGAIGLLTIVIFAILYISKRRK